MSVETVSDLYQTGQLIALDVGAILPMMRAARAEVAADYPDLAAQAELGDRDAASRLGMLRRQQVLAAAIVGRDLDAGLNNLLGSKE